MARKKRKTPPRDPKTGLFMKRGAHRAKEASKRKTKRKSKGAHARDFKVQSARKSLSKHPGRKVLHRDSDGRYTSRKKRPGRKYAPAMPHAKKGGGRKKHASSGKRSHASYVAAGKKAAATKKRNMRALTGHRSEPKPRKKKKHGPHTSGLKRSSSFHHGGQKSQKGKSGLTKAQLAAKVARMQKERREKGLPEAFDNPVSPLDAFAFFAVGGAGALAGFGLDAWLATHSVKAGAQTNNSNTADQPGAGQVYNVDGPATPMWSSWLRLTVGIGAPAVLVGTGVVKVLPGPLQTGFKVGGIGWGIMSAKKLLTDAGAKFLGNTAFGQRVFGEEIRAQNGLLNAKATAAAGNLLPPGQVHVPLTTGTAAVGGPAIGAAGTPQQLGAGACCNACAAGRPDMCVKNAPPTGAAAPPGYGKPASDEAPPPPPPKQIVEKTMSPVVRVVDNDGPRAMNFNRYTNENE